MVKILNFRLKSVLFLIMCSASFSSNAQVLQYLAPNYLPSLSSFESVTAGMGDIDQDGDWDVYATGVDQNYSGMSYFFTHNTGTYQLTNDSFHIVSNVTDHETVKWADFDNDGDLDLFIAGRNPDFDVYAYTSFYENDGSGHLTYVPGTTLPKLQSTQIHFHDFDSDGDEDMLFKGSEENSWPEVSYLFLNNGNFNFVNSGVTNLPVYAEHAELIDMNNDGIRDVFFIIDPFNYEGGFFFQSDGAGHFTYSGLIDGKFDHCKAADLDGDGDEDLILTGYDNDLVEFTHFYRNDNGTFTQVPSNLYGVEIGEISTFDFDNDGDLDIAISGQNCSGGICLYVFKFYQNNGAFNFSEVFLQNEPYSGGFLKIIPGDFDGDNDADFLICGEQRFNQPGNNFPVIYSNDNSTANTPPNPPTSFNMVQNGNQATLTWGQGTDSQTNNESLTYALRLGTTPGGSEIITAHGDLTTGFRWTDGISNMGYATSKNIVNLTPGTYYWSVQAIDNSFVGSVFSPEQSFTITATSITQVEPPVSAISIYPNPGNTNFTIQTDQRAIFKIFTLNGQLVETGSLVKGDNTLRLKESVSASLLIMEVKNADGETTYHKISRIN